MSSQRSRSSSRSSDKMDFVLDNVSQHGGTSSRSRASSTSSDRMDFVLHNVPQQGGSASRSRSSSIPGSRTDFVYTNDPYHMQEMREELTRLSPTVEDPKQGNPCNPSGANNNCVHVALGQIKGWWPDDVEKAIGPPPATNRSGVSQQELEAYVKKLGARLSKTPPSEDCVKQRKAAIAFQKPSGDWHFVVIEGGQFPANFRYTDYQASFFGKEVTDQWRSSRGEKLYMYIPTERDLSEEEWDRYEVNIEERKPRNQRGNYLYRD